MNIDPKELKAIFERGHVEGSDEKILYDVCEMVYSLHFKSYFEKRDDLIQEGILGIIKLVDEGYYDSSRDVLNFTYTRVRNSMSNFLFHEKGEYYTENTVKEKENDLDFLGEEKIEEVTNFIKCKLVEYSLDKELSYYVCIYFNDKLGVKCENNRIRDFSLDFVNKYRYYVNLIEYDIFKKFLNNKLFDNKIKDIISVLEAEGEIGFFQKMFLDSLDREQLTKLMYIFSNDTFIFPSKAKLLKIDNYIKIYKRIKFGNIEFNEAVKIFDRPLPTILSIVQKYDQIFSEE